MGERTLRYAVVGAGGHGGVHIRQIQQHGGRLGCELSAVAIRPQDRKPGQVKAFRDAGVEVFPDAVAMFDALAGRADAVFIPTSIYSHCTLTCAALGRGHNVYLEKPPAGTVQEIDRMLAAVADSGRICCLGFQAISSESIRWLKSRLADGSLGSVRRLRTWACWPRPDAYYARNEWAGHLKVGDAWVLDGPTNNALAHEIANMLYLATPAERTFATPRTVRAELYHARDIPSEDTSAVRIVTTDGVEAVFVASHCTAGAQTGPWIEMECSRATVHWRNDGRTAIDYDDGREETLDRDGEDSAAAALANFTQAVRADDAEALDCDLTMGRNFTLALNGAFESAGATRAIPGEYVSHTDEAPGPHPVIAGINDLIERCGREGKLYSEVGCAWATATEPFDLSGYAGFPQRFGA